MSKHKTISIEQAQKYLKTEQGVCELRYYGTILSEEIDRLSKKVVEKLDIDLNHWK